MKLVSALIFTAVLSTNVFAAQSSTIPLPTVSAKPGESARIDPSVLYPNVKYIIQCTIQNLNFSDSDEYSAFTLSQASTNFSSASVDDTPIAVGAGAVSYFVSSGSVLQIDGVSRSAAGIYIQNLDHDDTYTLSNCNAYLIS